MRPDSLSYLDNLLGRAYKQQLRWYGTLEYGDFHEKFNFLTIQDLRKTFEHLSKTF